MLKTLLSTISFNLLPFDVTTEAHKLLVNRLRNWEKRSSGKTKNKDIIWFPKPRTDLGDMRKMLTIAYEKQIENEKSGNGIYFEENELSKELAKLGTITRPGTGVEETISEYENEQTANQPHVSSFRMLNRIFRLLGWTTRHVNSPNRYVVTDVGIQMTKFREVFPSKIGNLYENDLVVRSLLNANVFSVNDNLDMWDTRFRNRIVVNLLRCANVYGYITIQEAIVTAFALKDERDPLQVKQMIDRMKNLHEGKITMIDAYKECRIDPLDSSSANNAYDSPKVLTSLCRQTGLFEHESVPLNSLPYGDLRQIYDRMFKGKSAIKSPQVVNVITDYGRSVLVKERQKKVIGFEQLYF